MELDNGRINCNIDKWLSENLDSYKRDKQLAKSARFVLVKWLFTKNGLLFGIIRITSLYDFADPNTREVPKTFPKVGTHQYVKASFTPFPVNCLLIASGSYTACSNQFNLAVQLYFKDNTIFDNNQGIKRKLIFEEIMDSKSAKKLKN